MKNKFCILATAVIAAAAMGLSLSSCSDKTDIDNSKLPGNYHYQLTIPNSNDVMTVVLDSITSPVKAIESTPDWVTVDAVEDSTVNNHPVLRVTIARSAPNKSNKGDIVLVSENNDMVTLTLTTALRFDDASNSNDNFVTDWENQTSTYIYSDKQQQEVALPWASSVVTTLPSFIRRDIKKSDGWEMAFSTLNKNTLDDCNYFALYNKYLGTLRVFYYVTNPSTTGSKYSFEVNLGSLSKGNKYPFYHSLQYAIPSSHNNVKTNMNLLTDNVQIPTTFKSFYTTYCSLSSSTLIKGWTAFDIDMSAYSPTEHSWMNSNEEMTFGCKTELDQKVTLDGTLSANISGKYSTAEQTASSSSGVSSLLKMAGSALGNVQNACLASIEQQLTGSAMNNYFRYAGATCNFAAYALDFMLQNKYEEHLVDSMPGKIEMSMTGDISLAGYIKSLAANQVAPLTIDVSNFSDYNSHMGQGVWSLADDPVIYLVDDRLLGDVHHFNLYMNSDSTYSNQAVADYHLRNIYFLDPTSIKLNINKDVFPDVSDVRVTCDYGVYPDIPKGHTTKFSNLLNLGRPHMKIIKEGERMGNVYQSLSSSRKTKYLQLPHTDFICKELEETSENCKVYKQSGADYYYYGKKMTGEGKDFILQPQVYLPYKITDESSTIYNGEVPDFVVLITVTFKSDGRTYIFTQRFIPKIATINGSDLPAKYNELTAYAEKCKNNQTINTLQNMSSVGVNHLGGDKIIQKTLNILNAVINK